MMQSQNLQRHDVIVLLVIPKASPVPGDVLFLMTLDSASGNSLDQAGRKQKLGKEMLPSSAMEDVAYLHHHGSGILVMHLSVTILCDYFV